MAILVGLMVMKLWFSAAAPWWIQHWTKPEAVCSLQGREVIQVSAHS